MIIRNLDSDADWTFGQGRQNYLRAEPAIELNIATRVRSFLNDCFWALEFGIDWWNLLGAKNPAAQTNILIQVRSTVANSFGVVRINTVEAVTDSGTRRLTVKLNIDTIYGHGISLTVQP